MSSAAGANEPPPDEPSPRDPPSGKWPRLFQNSSDPLFLLNSRRRLLYANAAWEAWANVRLAEVRGRPCRPARSTDLDLHADLLQLLSPTPEALAGRPSRVRRRADAVGAAWIDVDFFPWTINGQTSAILGRVAIVEAPQVKQAPLPEAVVQLREHAAARYRLEHWDSDIPEVQRVVAQARLASQNDVPILIHGPAGSGKQWLARTIHRLSPRREEFFAVLDARRLPPSLLATRLLQPHARSNLGALALRNPSRLPAELQSRLVELLDNGSLRPRLFVCATDEEVATLAPAFLARVGTLTIRIPPLAQRHGDWARLVPEILDRLATAADKPRLTIAPEADQALRVYNWPGNLTELETVLRDASRRAVGERIEFEHLPFSLRADKPAAEPKLPLDELLEKTERNLIQLALQQVRGNKSKAAQLLGIWRARLLRRMEQLGIADAEPPGDSDNA